MKHSCLNFFRVIRDPRHRRSSSQSTKLLAIYLTSTAIPGMPESTKLPKGVRLVTSCTLAWMICTSSNPNACISFFSSMAFDRMKSRSFASASSSRMEQSGEVFCSHTKTTGMMKNPDSMPRVPA